MLNEQQKLDYIWKNCKNEILLDETIMEEPTADDCLLGVTGRISYSDVPLARLDRNNRWEIYALDGLSWKIKKNCDFLDISFFLFKVMFCLYDHWLYIVNLRFESSNCIIKTNILGLLLLANDVWSLRSPTLIIYW